MVWNMSRLANCLAINDESLTNYQGNWDVPIGKRKYLRINYSFAKGHEVTVS